MSLSRSRHWSPCPARSTDEVPHHARKLAVARQQRIGREGRHLLAGRAEGHENHRHTGRPRGVEVGHRIAHQKRVLGRAAGPLHRHAVRRRIGLSDSQRIGAHQRIEVTAHPEPHHQKLRETLGLVGADSETVASRFQRSDRCHRSRVEHGMSVDRIAVGREETGIFPVDLRRTRPRVDPREPEREHRPPAPERGRGIRHRDEHRAMTQIVLLAAGQGTRMKSDRPKVLHEVAGRARFAHALASAGELDIDRRIVVVGSGAEAVAAAAEAEDPRIVTVEQREQLGTGHAVARARDALTGAGGDTIVLYGDTPFIRPETLAAMAAQRERGADIVVLGFEAADPGRYGRLVTEGEALLKIVEFKDASSEERDITLCNSGVIMAATETLLDLVAATGNDNASGEYYLTDIVEIGRAQGLGAVVVTCDEAETLGVNSRADLAAAEAAFQARARATALEDGVTLVSPETVFFSFDTVVGRDALIEPNVVFGPGVTVETGATIRAFTHLEGAHVSAGAVVGPFARLRHLRRHGRPRGG